MKRLLVVANLYHAYPRVPGLAWHLPELGWEVTVVTPSLDSRAAEALGLPQNFRERVRVVEAPYKGDIMTFWRGLFCRLGYHTDGGLTEQVGRSLGVGEKGFAISNCLLIAYQTVFAFPDTERTWLRPAIAAMDKLCERQRFDAVFSSSPFPTSHRIARHISLAHDLPWVADFRDPWTPNHAYPFPWFRKIIETLFEKHTMRRCRAMVAATNGFAEKISELHGRQVEVIPNGFDETTLNAGNMPASDVFTVSYTGSIYSGKQDPEKVLRTLSRLVRAGRIQSNHFRLRFYGLPSARLACLIKKHNVSDFVFQMGRLPRSQILEVQRESHALLFLNWEDPGSHGVLTTKIFEYLAAQRPILATGGFPGDDVENLIATTRSGIKAISDDEIEHVLTSWYDDWRETGRAPRYEGDREAILSYGYGAGARKLAAILDVVIGSDSEEPHLIGLKPDEESG